MRISRLLRRALQISAFICFAVFLYKFTVNRQRFEILPPASSITSLHTPASLIAITGENAPHAPSPPISCTPSVITKREEFQPVIHTNTSKSRVGAQCLNCYHPVYVFSAFSVPRANQIRVIAIADTQHHESSFALACLAFSTVFNASPSGQRKSRLKITKLAAQLEFLPEDHARRYSAAYITCFTGGTSTLPPHNLSVESLSVISVSHLLSSSKSNSIGQQQQEDAAANTAAFHCSARPINSLHVIHTAADEPAAPTLPPRPPSSSSAAAATSPLSNHEAVLRHGWSAAVCVTPLNLAYNRVAQLTESLAINTMLGAQHVFLYNYSSGPRVTRLLHRLTKQKAKEDEEEVRRPRVTVVQWRVPVPVHVWPVPPGYTEWLHYFGQIAALNDCVLRARANRHRLVALSDLDEFLIGRGGPHAVTWPQLFQPIASSSRAKDKRASVSAAGLEFAHAGWLFRNAFFTADWPSDPRRAANKTIAAAHSVSLLKNRREATTYPAFSRSKMIVRAWRVRVVGVHNVWNFESRREEAVEEGEQLQILNPETQGLCHHYRHWEGLGEQNWVEDRYWFQFTDAVIGWINRVRIWSEEMSPPNL